MPASPDPQRALGRAIRRRRDELGLSQEELATRAHLDKTWISHVEAGEQNPSWATVDRIARGLGWPLWRLAQSADQLETKDRRPTDAPLRQPPPRQRRPRTTES